MVVNELKNIIKRLRTEYNVTILLAEQNARFAMAVSEYIYFMEKGSIVFSGGSADVTQEVLERYLGT